MNKKTTTTETYSYDEEGNLVEKTVTTITEEYSYSPQWWQTPYPGTTPYITYTNPPGTTYTTNTWGVLGVVPDEDEGTEDAK